MDYTIASSVAHLYAATGCQVTLMMNSQSIRTAKILLLVCLCMFGFGFALVPLYNLFCDLTGINGKITDTVAYDPSSLQVDTSRTIKVRTLVVKNQQMPWTMQSQKDVTEVHPGKVYQMSYTVNNPTDSPMIAQAIPSVSPGNAAQYLKKIQCFCFDQIALGAKEKMDAHVLFYLDPDMPDEIPSVVLSYTLFDVTQQITN